MTANSIYHLMVKESDCIEDDVVSYVLEKLFGVLEVLDAGGKPITSISFDKNKDISLSMWLIVFEIWGSFLPLIPEINGHRARTIQKIKNTVEELETIYVEYEIISNPIIVTICTKIKTLEKLLYKILDYLESNHPSHTKNLSQISTDVLITTTATARSFYDYSKAGYLIPLACGHSGHYGDAEKLLLEEHLSRVGFLV
mmetsp:Transcript_10514/g.10507  ORF Transcript_10514/g.10507 Transcript_10514/m.10507 type:complete len:199 (+) Transcript_10514:1518-2114(+)